MYFSPFHIVFYGQNEIDIEQPFSYKKIRQRVLAKYELVDNAPIEIKGKLINKGEAIELIQVFKNEDHLKFHKQVFKDQELLTFLEDQNDTFLRRKDVAFEHEFKTWISEYFAESFALILQSELKGKYPNETFMAKDLNRYIQSYHFDLVFRKAVSQVRVLSAEFSDILSRSNEKGFKRECSLKADNLSKKYAQRLNKAKNHLEDAREELSETLLNTAILLNDEKAAYHLANRYTSFCLLLDTSPYLKEEVKRVHKVVVSNSRSGESPIPNSTSNIWSVVFRVVIVLVFAGGFFGRNCRDRVKKHEIPSGIFSKTTQQKASLTNLKNEMVNYFKQNVFSYKKNHIQYEVNELSNGEIIHMKNWIPFGKTQQTHISNLTQFDCIVFIRKPFFGSFLCEKDIYIKAGETVELENGISKNQVVLAYLGNQFIRSKCAYCDLPSQSSSNVNIKAGANKDRITGAFLYKAHIISDFIESTSDEVNHIKIIPEKLVPLDQSN